MYNSLLMIKFWVKKYKTEIIVSLILLGLFFLTRLIKLTSVPIFTDEAIYLRWAQIAKNDAAWRFISLTDGKQPLFVWLAMTAMKFIADPLTAGRLVSVLSGFVTMIGLWGLTFLVFRDKKVAFLSAFLYSISPFALVYDRMALMDTLVGTFSVLSLSLMILLTRSLRLDMALILGAVLGGGVLTKSSGFINLYLLPLTLLLFNWQDKKWKINFIRWLGLGVVSVVLAYGFYSILRLSPFFHIIDEKNTIFVYPFNEWITHPFTFFVGNWKALWDWLTTYVTWPILLLVFGSFFLARKFTKEKLILFSWFLVPFIALAVFGRNLYPRFILFMTLSLLPLASLSLDALFKILPRKYLAFILFWLFVLLPLRADYLILGNFSRAPLPRSDLDQYSSAWPAGGGVKEAIKFFKDQAKNGKIYISTEGTFGLMPYALELYLIDNPNITITSFWPVPDLPPKEAVEASKKMPAYFLFYQPCPSCKKTGEAPLTWPVTPIFQIEKGKNSYLTVYQLRPQ